MQNPFSKWFAHYSWPVPEEKYQLRHSKSGIEKTNSETPSECPF